LALQRFIFDLAPERFAPLVLENSQKGPVLVYYWSPRAAPCSMLTPRLVQLSEEYGGRFLLFLLNTDDHGAFARERGVNSIPTVQFYRKGALAETVHGAFSIEHFRGVLGRFLPPATAAAAAADRGDTQDAIAHLESAGRERPDDHRLALDRAKLLVRAGRHAEAAALLQSLPPSAQGDPEVALLGTLLEFVKIAFESPPEPELREKLAKNAADVGARFAFAARRLLADDFRTTLKELGTLIRYAAEPHANRARKGVSAILALLGPEHALAKEFEVLLHPPARPLSRTTTQD
jgi:putative thioredoxin